MENKMYFLALLVFAFLQSNVDAAKCGIQTCGTGAVCTGGLLPLCVCPSGYSGDPLSSCFKIECHNNSECRNDQSCELLQCVNPCEDACGVNANCKVTQHEPVCTCPPGYTGDPYVSCRTANA